MLLSHQGIILPSIKAHYQVTQSIVSIVFLCYASGFAIGRLAYADDDIVADM